MENVNCICTVDILGSVWMVRMCDLDAIPWFRIHNATGRSVSAIRTIDFVNPDTDDRAEYESDAEKVSTVRIILKHEIIHAFLAESGLDENSLVCDCPWPVNEGMVEFFAVQWEKINKAIEHVLGKVLECFLNDETRRNSDGSAQT